MDALGEAALHLPWLSPCAASLVALARAPTAETWLAVRCDPGCVLLLIRHALPEGAPSGLSFFPALLRDPAPLEAALQRLQHPGPGFVNWSQPEPRAVHNFALTCARLASLLAERTDRCPPDNAWAAGLLAPLGWLAACASGGKARIEGGTPQPPSSILDPRSSAFFDPAPLARRLNQLWRLPRWLGAVTGHLALPVEDARSLGADPDLFRIVQLAVGLASQSGQGLRLAVGAGPAELAAAFGLSGSEVEALVQVAAQGPACPFPWESPESLPLLPDLLRLAAENRRVRAWPTLEGLHQDVDALQSALERQRAGEENRLRQRKLTALAELAAGAGHEINNPLAVISGQAQYLLKKVVSCQLPVASQEGEADSPLTTDNRQLTTALQTIVNQANRIHQTLTDLMQFARPQSPKRQAVDAGPLIREVTEALLPLAEQRQVRLTCAEPPAPVTFHADPVQTRTALRCLLRNAIEAAPPEGWASVRVESGDEGPELVIEDSGPGLSAADREHLFDPFYCGRKAGRGRGLGLPTAWRLAREHGGDVYHEPRLQGPTRFVLRLPVLGERETPPPTDSESGPADQVRRNGANGVVPSPAASGVGVPPSGGTPTSSLPLA